MDKNEIYKKIGKNIQNERKKQGFSQEKFAEHINVSWSYISKIEAGYLNLSIGKLIDFAEYLNIELEKLLKL